MNFFQEFLDPCGRSGTCASFDDTLFDMMKKRILALLALIVSLAFIVLAVFYWTTPAGMLPSFMPGFIQGSSIIHYKHGIAALIVGLAALALSWFSIGKRR